MSCDAAALSVHLWLAAVSASPHAQSEHLLRTISAVAAPGPLAKEPLYADIVARAGALKKEVRQYEAKGLPTGLDAFKAKVEALSALDMKGHLDLAKRGTDGDLKCILRGISQDLPKRLGELAAAAPGPARQKALEDMAYLLNDNVEVITAPPHPPV